MGGEGAKERRRLKRLGQNGGSEAAAGEKKGPPFKRNDARMKSFAKHQFQKKPFGSGAKGAGKFKKSNNKNNSNFPTRDGAATKIKFQAKPKRKTSKKPKHLKRKLEQLGEDNAEEREAVLKKLTEFERAKEKFNSQSKKNKNVHSSKDETKDALSEENNDKTEDIKAFPRGGGSDKNANGKKESPEPDSSSEIAPPSGGNETTISKPDKKKKKTAPSSNEEEKGAHSTESSDEVEEIKAFPRGGGSEDSVGEKKESPVQDSSSEESSSDTKTTTSKPDKGDNDDSNSDSDDQPGEPRRQRGRRRRGRKDTAKLVAETTPVDEDIPIKRVDAAGDEDKGETATNETKKRSDSDRYCKGRKPVTDFAVGKCYPGKVVYVKPFGVFIDIGCHSDAFCHVSRLSDDYVESPETVFKEGDKLVPRIVEIDRKKKKITASLQSEARIADEHASMVARKERKVLRQKSSKAKPITPKTDFSREDSSFRKGPTSIEKPTTPRTVLAAEAPKPKPKPILPPDESTMTPAELKRARKLARRAARREQSEGGADQ